MYEELIKRLKALARLEAKNGESVIHVSSEAAACIKEIAQEAADAIENMNVIVRTQRAALAAVRDEAEIEDIRRCKNCANAATASDGFKGKVYCRRYLIHLSDNEDARRCKYFEPKMDEEGEE